MVLRLFIFVFGLVTVAADATAQEWSYYGATQSGTRYSSLDQINRNNVEDLEVAWIYRTGELNRFTEAQVNQQSFENTCSSGRITASH
jgi:glucose dehydrogenase